MASATDQRIIGPGGVIGIVGGGQLGRMIALAARKLGYGVHVLDPEPRCPASHVADHHTVAAYGDVAVARRFADGVDVVTFEFENVPAEALAAIAHDRPVRPDPSVLHTTRHRAREKAFVRSAGVAVADFHGCHSLDDLRAGIARLGAPAVLKTCELGYDGKGQVKITDAADGPLQRAWESLRTSDAVLEAWVPFDREVSVLCARGVGGEVRCWEPVWNVHTNHILDTSVCPAPIPAALAEAARDMARTLAGKLGHVGVLAVEMFVVGDRLLVNELAPRVHNSGHLTDGGSVTSQFEQHVRAVCGLPLGDPAVLGPCAMANLLGDLWFARQVQREPDWAALLAAEPAAKLHLYGKAEPRRGRKMGHVVALGATPDDALRRATAARAALRWPA